MDYDKKRISIHHVGGRSGSRTFPVLKRFEKDIINVLYDADTDCLDQIKEAGQGLGSEFHVLPYCLADACRPALLNITYDPFASSLYVPNPDYGSYYYTIGNHDAFFYEVGRVMEKRNVKAVTLDYIFKSKDIHLPPPDFISIDTQGAEYDILLGAKDCLKSGILALVVESEFHPLYTGQKIFGDIAKLLSGQGFDFVKFIDLNEMSPYRAPKGMRSEGFCVSSDALFLKRIDNIVENGPEASDIYYKLRKSAFIAIVFNQFEYALECLRRTKSLAVAETTGGHGDYPAYFNLLDEIEKRTEQMAKVYPPTFSTKYPSFDASKSRFYSFASTELKTGAKYYIKTTLKKVAMLYRLLQYIRKAPHKLKNTISTAISPLKTLTTPYSDIEKILIRHGLKNQADSLRNKRLR